MVAERAEITRVFPLRDTGLHRFSFTCSSASGYGKPRPTLIVQADSYPVLN